MSLNVNKIGDQHSIAIEMEPNSAGGRRRQGNSATRAGRDLESSASDAETLLEPDLINRRKPPVAKPEMDDDDDEDEDLPRTPAAHPGVDDGFFPVTRTNGSDRPSVETDDIPNGNGPRRRPSRPVSPFPYSPGFEPGFIDTNSDGIPDVNVYQHKKTLAQGMMDLALLSANANQLRYVLESYKRHPYYYVSLSFISISLVLQIAVGIGLILNSRYNVKDEKQICIANRINNFTIIGIFIVTVVNVFISAFGVADAPSE